MLKKFSPITPSQRQLIQIDRSDLYKGRPMKSFVVGKVAKGGRNNVGSV